MKINLKTALLANAIFSTSSGIGMLVLHEWLSNLMGIGQELALPIIGTGLIVFASSILYHATRKVIRPLQVKLIIAQDLMWVIASAVVVGFQLFHLTTVGYVLMVIVALAVADFAYLQFRGLRISLDKE